MDIVDLCESSEEDSDAELKLALELSRKEHESAKKQTKTSPKTAQSIDLCDSSDDEDDVLLHSPRIFSRKRKLDEVKAVEKRDKTDSRDLHASLSQSSASSAITNPYARSSSASKPTPRSLYNQSSKVSQDSGFKSTPQAITASQDDSISSVVNPYACKTPGSSINLSLGSSQDSVTSNPYKKTPAASQGSSSSIVNPYSARKSAATPSIRKQLLHKDDDSDDDILMYTPSGLNLATTEAQAQQEPLLQDLVPRPTNTRQTLMVPHRRIGESNFSYPQLLRQSKQYDDLRVLYLWSFWNYGRTMVNKSYQRPKVQTLALRVVNLALGCNPVRSLEEFATKKQKVAVKDAQADRQAIQQELVKGRKSNWNMVRTQASARRKFHSVSEACLVLCLEKCVRLWNQEHVGSLKDAAEGARDAWLQRKECWMSLADLLVHVEERLLDHCPGRLARPSEPDRGLSYYMQSHNKSMEYLQIEKLYGNSIDGGQRLKKHSYQSQWYMELLPAGFETAVYVQDRIFPMPPGPYRCSKAETVCQVPEEYRNICLGVDMREGGGSSKNLHFYCNKLDNKKVPFFVASLKIGDYCFFSYDERRGEYLLVPLIVERKSVPDVSQSIYDGRWKNQKHRMYVGQFVFGYDKCHMVYMIEGHLKKHIVNGNFIGNEYHRISEEQWWQEIRNLKEEGFDVMRTTSDENSMFTLSRWAKLVAKEVAEGRLKPTMTYEDFVERVKGIDAKTDFSRLSRYHYKERRATGNMNPLLALGLSTLDREVDGEENRPEPTKKKAPAKIVIKDNYDNSTQPQLQQACIAVGLPKSGPKHKLIERLRGPHPPKVWLERKQAGHYV